MKLFDAPALALPIHPTTGLQAVGLRADGRPIWPILGGDGTGDGGAGGGGSGGTGAGGGAGDGGQQYTPPATQADLDRIVESRLSRERAKYSDYDDLKAKAGKYDELENELASDKDKAVNTARAEERTNATNEWAPKVVRAEFRAAAKGVLTDEQRDALLEDLDLSKFIDDKGNVDEEKIANKVKAVAGGPGNNNGRQILNGTIHQSRDLGQGNRQQSVVRPGDQGRAMAEKRFGNKS